MGHDELGDMGRGTFGAHEGKGLVGADAPSIKKLSIVI